MATLASFFPVAAHMLSLKVAMFDMLYGAFFALTQAIVLTAPLGSALDLRCVVSQSPQCIYDRCSPRTATHRTRAPAVRPN